MMSNAFISQMMPHAMRVSQATGIDPRIVIAQSALETGWGKSAPGNNYFGIKSHGKPGGNTFATKEVVNGQTIGINDSFRAYGGMGQSADDYAAFLQSNPRYRPMLEAQGIDAQIEALGRSGYATDPQYANKVRSIASGIDMDNLPPVSAAPPIMGGEGNDTLQARASTQGAPMGLFDSFQQQEEPQRFGDKLRASAADGSLWDGLALAANSLRHRPDAGLAQMISQRQESREGAKRKNRTVEWMRANGMGDLAGAVESGALSAQQAIAMVMQQPEDNRTDDMREWEVAQSGGYGGTFADWMGKTGGAEMSAKEKEIERIMRTWGVDEKTAVGVADGIVVVSPNPLTGKPELVNKLTGDTMSGQTAQQPTRAPGGEISVESLPRVEGARDAFGVEGIARDAVNAVAGAAGLPAPFGTTQDAINYFDSFGESILRDIAQAYPRMPAESRMKKLEGLVPKAGGFQGWDNARSKLGTLRNEFETDMGIAKQSLGQSLSPEVRQEIELKIIGLQAAIAKVDQALGALGGAGTTSGNAGTTSGGLKWSVK